MTSRAAVRRSSRASRALTAALLALAAAAGPAPALAKPGAEGGDGRLSDERHLSYWAFSESRDQIRRSPDLDSPVVAKVRLNTELGAPHVYLALRRRTDKDGAPWLEVRVPMRPNGRVGWVREDALGPLHVNRTQLRISLGRRRATLYEQGRRVWSARVGIGRPGTRTPKGHFYVRERLRLGNSGGPYGTFAFGTSAYSPGLSDWPGGGVVGVHGTNQPELIPGAISHGCVRVRNREINKLRRLMDLGTPILIR